MMLKELIEELKGYRPGTKVANGFHRPHSFRGYYEQLAFEPCEDTTVEKMLACAQEALGSTYMGYKGGDFTMTEWTDVWLAEYGSSGDPITAHTLKYMIEGDAWKARAEAAEEKLKRVRSWAYATSHGTAAAEIIKMLEET